MHLIYVDETDDHTRRYSAYTALIYHIDNIPTYRNFLISGLRDIFGREPQDATAFPTLHASELPVELGENKKIELFDLIAQAIAKYCTGVIREGYSWEQDAVVSCADHNNKSALLNARKASLSSLRIKLSDQISTPIQFIVELDKKTFEFHSDLYNIAEPMEQQLQLSHIYHGDYPQTASNTIGTFYCEKRDHVMYSVDFCARQLAIQDERSPSAFKVACAQSISHYRDKVLHNRIVGVS